MKFILIKNYQDKVSGKIYKKGTEVTVRELEVLDKEDNWLFDYDSSISKEYLTKEINLYVDDLRTAPDTFKIARNVEEAKYYINNFDINILSIDHDLGIDDEGRLLSTGYDLVKYICENNIIIKEIYIHTDNPVGREAMFETLCSAQRHGFINKDIKIYNHYLFPNKYE